MINAAELLAAHAQLDRSTGANGDSSANTVPAPRQFPLAGQAEVRPLADPSRTGAAA
jgi:hypothetical protein